MKGDSAQGISQTALSEVLSWLSKQICNQLHNVVWIGEDHFFPNSEDFPTFRFQFSRYFPIAAHVVFNLCYPIIAIVTLGKFCPAVFPVIPVPEVAIRVFVADDSGTKACGMIYCWIYWGGWAHHRRAGQS